MITHMVEGVLSRSQIVNYSTQDPGTKNSGVSVLYAKEKMTKIECEFGCDCDTVGEHSTFNTVLEPEDFERLIQEKMDRARRYQQLQDKIGGQFESD